MTFFNSFSNPQEDFDSSKPFLDHEPSDSPSSIKRQSSYRGSLSKCFCSILLVFLIYDSVISTVNLISRRRDAEKTYSPAKTAVRHEIVDSWDERGSEWLQKTHEEQDSMWQDILINRNLNISRDEMLRTQPNLARIEDDTVRTTGDGYLGILGVYHSLHCLNILRIAVFQDKYDLNEGNLSHLLQAEHYDHCIDFLRDDVMCHADLTLYRAAWVKKFEEPESMVMRGVASRECADWDGVAGWAHSHALQLGSYRVLPGPFDKESVSPR